MSVESTRRKREHWWATFDSDLLTRGRRLAQKVFQRLGAATVIPAMALARLGGRYSATTVVAADGPRLLWKPHSASWTSHTNAEARHELLGFLAARPSALRRTLAFEGVLRNELLKSHAKVRAQTIMGPVRRVRGADVAAVVEVSWKDIHRFPHMDTSEVESEQWLRHYSLLEAAAQAIAGWMGDRISAVGCPTNDAVTRRDVDDVLRNAGELLLGAIVDDIVRAPPGGKHFAEFLGNMFSQMNAIAGLAHERREGRGDLFLGCPDDTDRCAVSFRRPIPLADPGWARKALEMATSSLGPFADGFDILGLMSTDNDAHQDSYIRFQGRGRWEVSFIGVTLMQSIDGIPRLPHQPLTFERLHDALRRVFGASLSKAANTLYQTVSAVLLQSHGTMVVIAQDAAAEVIRLAACATPITPTTLDPEVARAVTAIDGAVFLDLEGKCHGVGVVVDGSALPHGAARRGARYNSACRYVFAGKKARPRMAIVVSEDGKVDVFPRLRPQMSRARWKKLHRQLKRTIAAGRSPSRTEAQSLVPYFDYLSEKERGVVWNTLYALSYVLEQELEPPFEEFDEHDSDFTA